MPKKVILCASSKLAYDQRMLRISYSLATAGYSVLLVGRTFEVNEPALVEPFSTHQLYCKRQKGAMAYLEFNVKLFKFLCRQPLQILHLADPDTGLAGLCLKLIKRFKLVYDSHELFIEVPELQNRNRVKQVWFIIERLIVLGSAARITVGNGVAKALFRMHKKPFQIVRNVPFSTHTDIEERFNLQKPFILYQGAVNKGRGLFELILAAKELPYHVYIAGRGDEYDTLVGLVKKLNLYDRVHFLGYVKPALLKGLTQEAYLGYNLIESASKSYYLSLSNKFFDYVHALVPSINPEFPEYQQLIQQHKVGITCNLSARAIVDAIKKMDEAQYKAMQQACAEAKKEWNWEHEQEILLAIYAQL